MSRILAIDTSTVAATVAVIDGEKVLAESYTAYKLKHSEKILPMCDHLLKDVRLKMEDMDWFAVGSGPGSFTGLRIAASTVKAFCNVTGKRIVSVSSLEACAYPLRFTDCRICVIFDAQRNDVYTNIFEGEGGGLKSVFDKDCIMDIDKLLETLKNDSKVFFTGDGLYKYRDKITEVLGEKACFAGEGFILPRAASVGLIADRKIKDNKDIYDYTDYLPNYIRPSAAEEQRNRRKML